MKKSNWLAGIAIILMAVPSAIRAQDHEASESDRTRQEMLGNQEASKTIESKDGKENYSPAQRSQVRKWLNSGFVNSGKLNSE